MKTSTIIIAAILTLQMNLLFAGNEGGPVKSSRNLNTVSLESIAPVTPAVADFEETTFTVEYPSLAPVTPAEASFDDVAEDITIMNLDPVTPNEADFNDEPADMVNTRSLAPETPAMAEFDEQ